MLGTQYEFKRTRCRDRYYFVVPIIIKIAYYYIYKKKKKPLNLKRNSLTVPESVYSCGPQRVTDFRFKSYECFAERENCIPYNIRTGVLERSHRNLND